MGAPASFEAQSAPSSCPAAGLLPPERDGRLVLPEGETVLVIGHSDTIPAIVQRLGWPLVAMADDEYDRMVRVTIGGAKPSILVLRYRDRNP